VTPIDLLERFGSDAVRYWAAGGRPGTDTAFDQSEMKVGRRLATKLLNASRFVLGFGSAGSEVSEPLDLAMLASLDSVVAAATAALEDFEYTTALEVTERFFWSFCDDYLELVKQRAYSAADDSSGQSARLALRLALSSLQRLFAPFLPFSAEEAWSWWHDDSVHTSSWPLPSGWAGDVSLLEGAGTVSADIRAAGNVVSLAFEPDDQPELLVDVTLELSPRLYGGPGTGGRHEHWTLTSSTTRTRWRTFPRMCGKKRP
jgi:valyl-tRNA synthetase